MSCFFVTQCKSSRLQIVVDSTVPSLTMNVRNFFTLNVKEIDYCYINKENDSFISTKGKEYVY